MRTFAFCQGFKHTLQTVRNKHTLHRLAKHTLRRARHWLRIFALVTYLYLLDECCNVSLQHWGVIIAPQCCNVSYGYFSSGKSGVSMCSAFPLTKRRRSALCSSDTRCVRSRSRMNNQKNNTQLPKDCIACSRGAMSVTVFT